MAELRDAYLDYLTTSGLLDEERQPAQESPATRPSERLPSWDKDDTEEPSLSPEDLHGPIAAKLGKETADLLVPYLMKSVSRMAPLLTEALQAARRGGKSAPPVSPLPDAEPADDGSQVADLLRNLLESGGVR